MDRKERIIYVGKAKSLRSRVSSYFSSSVKTIKTERLMAQAASIKTIVTENEVEAFLLESNLIKTEQPKYNILLKDSKGYPYVELTGERYPRLIYTRNTRNQSSRYIGPFVEAGELKEMMEYLRDIFPLRSCNIAQFNKSKACMKYQIKRCLAPCEHLISDEKYAELVDEVKRFFQGDTLTVRKTLQTNMAKAADEMKYELAAFYRDRLNAINKLFAKQHAVDINESRNLDLFYKYESPQTVGVTQMFVRGGRLIGTKTHFFAPWEDNLLERFIIQFYANIRQFPDMIVAEGEDISDSLAEGLSSMAGKKITIRKRGFTELIKLAHKNAEHAMTQYTLKAVAGNDIFPRLNRLAGRDIYRTECIDISHLGGEHTVGVSVVMEGADFDRKSYRKYKITTAGNNDVQSMFEVMTRKMKNIADHSETEPDLYLIDGGVSQLNAAYKALKEANCEAAILSITEYKAVQITGEYSFEEVHRINQKNPIRFKKNDPLLLYLQKIRNEAHRVAIAYSRSLALKRVHSSPLLQIEGIGKKRVKDILTAMPDIYTRKDITAEELAAKAKLPMNIAEHVIDFIKKNSFG